MVLSSETTVNPQTFSTVLMEVHHEKEKTLRKTEKEENQRRESKEKEP